MPRKKIQKKEEKESAAHVPKPRVRKPSAKSRPAAVPFEAAIPAAVVSLPESAIPQSTISRPLAALVAVLVLVVVGSIGTAAHFYHKYSEVAKQSTPEGELDTLLMALAPITDLPASETPTLATVTDRSKLSEQAFFAQAENGDKVLLYRDAGRAILYRPSTGKLVNVAAIASEAVAAAPAAQPLPSTPDVAGASTSDAASNETSESAPVDEQSATDQPLSDKARVALYNGTAKVGITNAFEGDFLVSNSDAEVVDKSPAARKDYDRTIIIDITHQFTSFAEELAADVGTSVEELPEGEAVPKDADILIIVGRDRI